jgi:Asp-tRNA(Asn)/Glu-tRNA(Gln) amidotransferase C subunit
LPPDASEQGLEPIPENVQSALEALLTLAESLRELDLDDVEPAFGPVEWS